MRSIALLSEKGGTAKTTTALNLAAGLGLAGFKVLVIDTDPQANATYVLAQGERFGQQPADNRPTLCHVLLDAAPIGSAIRPTTWVGVDLIPGEAGLQDVNLHLTSAIGRERRCGAPSPSCRVTTFCYSIAHRRSPCFRLTPLTPFRKSWCRSIRARSAWSAWPSCKSPSPRSGKTWRIGS